MMKETEGQPRSLKLTIKLKRETNISKTSTDADQPKIVAGEPNGSNNPSLTGSPVTSPPYQVENEGTTEVEENPSPENTQLQLVTSSPYQVENEGTTEVEENPSPENNQLQLVLYDPSVNGDGEAETDHEPELVADRPRRPHPFSNQPQRVLPSVGAFTVQCANCFKWRLIPTKEKYEEIREHIMEQPFLCETAREWRADVSCDDPPDITQDGSRLWAIDKPSIAQPPPRWQRLLRIRGEGSTKFADVYYVAPTGKRLRSMVEVQRFLSEHPSYIEEGVTMSQFSFQIPRPLQENYVRKRPARAANSDNAHDQRMPGPLDLSEVHPIAWAGPDVGTDLQLSSGISSNQFEASGSAPETQPSKKKKTSAKKRCNSEAVYKQNDVKVEDSPGL